MSEKNSKTKFPPTFVDSEKLTDFLDEQKIQEFGFPVLSTEGNVRKKVCIHLQHCLDTRGEKDKYGANYICFTQNRDVETTDEMSEANQLAAKCSVKIYFLPRNN